MIRKSLVAAACLIMAATANPAHRAEAAGAVPPAAIIDVQVFPDVSASHWASEKINILASYKVISGYEDGTFLPDALLTRAELASILVNAVREKAVLPDKPSFHDTVKEMWYFSAVETAKSFFSADTSLGKGKFRPGDFVTRQEAATAMVQARKAMAGKEDPGPPQASFADYDSIGPEYRDSIDQAVNKRLVSGYPDKTFRPGRPLTRAEAASLVYNSFFAEMPLEALVKNGDIAFFDQTSKKLSDMAQILEAHYGNWEGVQINFYVREMPSTGSGDGTIQVYAKVDPFKYFTFSEVIFNPNPQKTLEYAQKISEDITRSYPGRRNIVIIGYSETLFYNTAAEVYGSDYARYIPSQGGWRVERAFAATMSQEGRIAATWVESGKT